MNLIQENINNLTSLWKLAADRCGIFQQYPGYSISWIPGSDWPNRLWFTQEVNQKQMSLAIEQAKIHNLGISIWDGIDIPHYRLEEAGLGLKSELKGMSLHLKDLNFPMKELEIIRVNETLEAGEWSSLFQEAFGYRIDSYTILNTSQEVNYFIARYHQEPVGTAVLYQQNDEVAGIHSMGIIPSMRRKGFAEELMLSVLQMAQSSGAQLATLQASAMGKGLYLKTGFQEHFSFKTYINKTQDNNESNRQLKMEIRH